MIIGWKTLLWLRTRTQWKNIMIFAGWFLKDLDGKYYVIL